MGLNSFQTSGNSPGTPRCPVGILGFGTVGSAIARRLTGPDSIPSLELTHICDRRARDKRARQPESSTNRIVWTDTFDDLLASDAEIRLPSTVIAYTVYATSPDTAARLGTSRLGVTVPFVLYGVFRYLYLVHQKRGGGSPSTLLLADGPLLVCVGLWTATVGVLMYSPMGR